MFSGSLPIENWLGTEFIYFLKFLNLSPNHEALDFSNKNYQNIA